MFRFRDHASLPVPARPLLRPLRRMAELGEHSRGLAGPVPLLCGLPHLTPDNTPQPLIACQSEDVIYFVRLAPAHQLIAAEPGISPQNDPGVWPRCTHLQHNSLDLRQT